MPWTHDQMAARAAKELQDGFYDHDGVIAPDAATRDAVRVAVDAFADNGCEVEEIVPTGSLDPDAVHLAGIYVHRLVLNATPEKRIEKRTTKQNPKGA